MEPWGSELRGRIDEHEFESEALQGNALGDPHRRPLWVYLPPGYDEDGGRRYPSIYVIQGLTGQLDMWRNRLPFRRNFPELADELFASGESPPAILVYVDCWTSIGGSSTRPERVGTTPTCVTRSSRGSTGSTAHSRRRRTGESLGSRAAATARW
jgi:hypothetical protein